MRFKYKLPNAKSHEYGENDLRAERYAPAREPLGVTAPFFPHLNFAFCILHFPLTSVPTPT